MTDAEVTASQSLLNVMNESDFNFERDDLSLIKNYKNPPYMVKRIVEGVMMLLGKRNYPWTATHSELCSF